MAPDPHPLRYRAIDMMRRGMAYPEEIAKVLDISPHTARTWRRRAGVSTREARLKYVRRQLFRELE